jgi:GT2 family glycosyltransferase
VPQKGWLEGLVEQLEKDPEVGIAGGMALFADGLLAHAGVAVDANLAPVYLYRRLPATFAGANRKRRMRAVVGCLLVHREAFHAAGGFDEAYQSHWGEMDFCFQAGRQGWKVAYTPESLFICLSNDAPDPASDRQRFFAKWVGDLWPDQDSYWAEDHLNPIKLAKLYREVIDGAPQAAENLTT